MKGSEDADARFSAFASKFLGEYLERNPTRATEAGEHRHDGRWPDTSAEGETEERAFVEARLRELEAIPVDALSTQNRVDRGVIENRLRYWLFAIDELRQEAAVRKGNYVVLDVVRQDNPATISLGGRLFLCDSKPANLAQASTSSSSSACEPDCSPGYVCLRGQCVSACNPPCEKTERCGEDRLCRPKP